MDKLGFYDLDEGDLVEIASEGRAEIWQGVVKEWPDSDDYGLVVKAFKLPLLSFTESVMSADSQIATIGTGRKLWLNDWTLPICNVCNGYLIRPQPPKRVQGREIFSPWTCKGRGCSVAWWGNAGSYPADQPTRTARKELVEAMQQAGLKIPRGLLIGRLNRTEAAMLLTVVSCGQPRFGQACCEIVFGQQIKLAEPAAAPQPGKCFRDMDLD